MPKGFDTNTVMRPTPFSPATESSGTEIGGSQRCVVCSCRAPVGFAGSVGEPTDDAADCLCVAALRAEVLAHLALTGVTAHREAQGTVLLSKDDVRASHASQRRERLA